MSRRLLVCSVVVLVWACASPGGGRLPVDVDVYWVGGDWGSWMDGDNWDDDNIWRCDDPPCDRPYEWPDNTDDLFFYVGIDSDEAGVERVHVMWDGYGMTVSGIEFRGEVQLLKWGPFWAELVVAEPNGFVNYGGLSVEIDVRGDIVNKAGGAIEFSGPVNVFGDLHNEAGAVVTADRDDVDVEGGAVYNAGQMWLTGNGGIGEGHLFENTGTIRLFSGVCHGSAFVNRQDGLIRGFGYVTSSEGLRNKGTIEAVGGPLLLYVGEGKLVNEGKLATYPGASVQLMPAEDFNNVGTIEINRDGAVRAECNVVNEADGHIRLLGGTLSAESIVQEDGAVLSGFGGISGDLAIKASAVVSLTGPAQIIGEVEIEEGGCLEVSDGVTLVTGHTTCNGTIRMKGGRIIPQGGLSGDCDIMWEPGPYNNVADFNLDGKVNMTDYVYFAETWLWESAL
jgi:hypothetical protein